MSKYPEVQKIDSRDPGCLSKWGTEIKKIKKSQIKKFHDLIGSLKLTGLSQAIKHSVLNHLP